MRAGPCDGVTGTGDCVNSGWSPNWLAPLAWADQVEALVGTDTVCPFCVVERAFAPPRVPGFTRTKVNRIKGILAAFNCMRPTGSRSVGHVHLYDFETESLHVCRGHAQPIVDGERGY